MCILRVFFRFSLRSIVDPLENLGRKPGECWWLSFRTQAPTKKARRFNGGNGELNWKEMKRVVQRRWNKCFIWGICRVHERAANWWMDWAENLQKNGKRLGSEDLICRIASSKQQAALPFFLMTFWIASVEHLGTGSARGKATWQNQWPSTGEIWAFCDQMSQVSHFWWMLRVLTLATSIPHIFKQTHHIGRSIVVEVQAHGISFLKELWRKMPGEGWDFCLFFFQFLGIWIKSCGDFW